MSSRLKIFTGITGVLLVTLVTGFLFIRYQIRKSYPEPEGTITLTGISAPVTVGRDRYGVPRIEAENEHDLLFALGYVHAQDRLWQMDMTRRIGLGRLSELFGGVTLPFDRMFRIVGIRRIAENIEKQMTPSSRARVQAYADGINRFIETHAGKYPIEFDILRYDPEPWTPLHSIIIGRLMAWELNLSWWADLTLGALVDKLGYEKARDVFPSYPANVPPTVPPPYLRAAMPGATAFLHTAREYALFRGIGGFLGGSNAWAVAPTKSASGKVILANDTHLQLTQPSKWYEAQLVCPEYSVAGFSIPGVPGIVSGSNTHIAWGVTNVMADDADFYIIQIDSTDAGRYIFDGRPLPIMTREERIEVRNDTTHYVTIRSTHHGPIVTDIKTMLKKGEPPFVASMRWTGAEFSDQIEAFNKINKARNWDEFSAGVKEFSGPGQNFVYGDIQGNIGYRAGMWLPIRTPGLNPTLPLPGWQRETEWRGFVPFVDLPFLYNPPDGYVATANNKLVDDTYPHHISNIWEPPSRIQRLREVLGRQQAFSVRDFELLQNDQLSLYAKELTPFILAACADEKASGHNALAMEYLKNWNFVFGREDVATAIYQQFLTRLIANIFRDEMGEALFHDYVILVNIPLRVTLRLVQEGTSLWFDDIVTPEVETRDDIIRRSMKQALDILRETLGDETRHWQWGALHTVTLQHPFGLQKPLDKVFSIGPYPYGGGSTVMTSGEYNFNDVLNPGPLGTPFGVTVGASFRRIVDMANPLVSQTILPSGQSGQVMHPHYADQTPLWLNGAYKTVHIDSASSVSLLRLEPVR